MNIILPRHCKHDDSEYFINHTINFTLRSANSLLEGARHHETTRLRKVHTCNVTA